MNEEQANAILIELNRHSRELSMIRQEFLKVINYMHDAESEIPEKMRRFIMYMHDVHDVSYMYEERGHAVPQHILREMERCDDRYRQLLKELHLEDGVFGKVRRKMAEDPENRWDHTRQLKGPTNETGPSIKQSNGLDKDGAEVEHSQPQRRI